MTIADLAHDPEPVLGAAYDVIRELGRGGMAVVYLARERATGRERAIKVIHSRYLGDSEAVARFTREAKLVGALDHPNIVPIVAVERLDGGGLALVMDRVPGRTLKQMVREDGPLSPALTERVIEDIAAALGHAHAHGIVHRDVKPENIFVDESTGRALLSDFGIARSMESETQLTLAGVAIGTPTYMAPEQIEGVPLDGRSDLYSLGLVAWEMMSGKRPWEGETLYSVIYHQKHDKLPAIDTLRLDAPPRLLAAIEGLLEKSPDARWASAEDLRKALHSTAPIRRRLEEPGEAEASLATGDTVALDRSALKAATNGPRAPSAPSVSAMQGAADLEDTPVAPRLDWQGLAKRALKRFGPVAIAAALLISATLVFARPEPSSQATTVRAPSAPLHDAGGRQVPVAPSTAPSAAPSTAPSAAPVAAPIAAPTNPPAAEAHAARVVPEPPRMAGVVVTSPDSGVPTSTDSIPDVLVQLPDKAPPAAAAQPTVSVPPAVTAAPPRVTLTPPAARPRDAAAPSAAVARTASSDASGARRMSVVVGAAHTCLLSSDGRTYCWGGDSDGQLGTGVAAASVAPRAVSAPARFTRIASGATHTCALTGAGAAYCWGANENGELGDGTTTGNAAPERVAGGRSYVAIAAGASHTCALAADGRVSCWGAGSHGQLGNGATADRATPTPVGGATRFSDLASGWNHTCALTETGTAYCWGSNTTGSLGDGTTTDRAVPTPVRTAVRFMALSAGSGHTCGIATTGAAYCWGLNRFGQLGDGTTSSRLLPTPVSADLRFAAISAGGVSTCAITRDHQAWCWGRNAYGQLGDGSSVDRARPVRVAGDHSFVTVSTFGAHACATTTTDELFCWGYNLDGQLGDGSRDHRNRPVYVERPAG